MLTELSAGLKNTQPRLHSNNDLMSIFCNFRIKSCRGLLTSAINCLGCQRDHNTNYKANLGKNQTPPKLCRNKTLKSAFACCMTQLTVKNFMQLDTATQARLALVCMQSRVGKLAEARAAPGKEEGGAAGRECQPQEQKAGCFLGLTLAWIFALSCFVFVFGG